MRYINNRHLPRLVNTQDADDTKTECEGLGPKARKEYIKEHGDCWTHLRPALWQLGNMKCWYSESLLQEQEGHVEHYRPKNRLHGAAHQGYWWRAFDWTNMRLSHPTSNIRRKDYLTGEAAGKGSYFPLREGCVRATDEPSEANEQPVLLDPTSPTDCKLLSFDTSNGKPIPRFDDKEDAWKYYRAQESINYYHLDEGTWNYKRKDLIDEVSVLCDKLLKVEESGGNSDELIEELIKYLEAHAEFISASKQVIREKGLLELVA